MLINLNDAWLLENLIYVIHKNDRMTIISIGFCDPEEGFQKHSFHGEFKADQMTEIFRKLF
jgi:hypothetical protein